MDFFTVKHRTTKKDNETVYAIYPDFKNRNFKQFMIRGARFYARRKTQHTVYVRLRSL